MNSAITTLVIMGLGLTFNVACAAVGINELPNNAVAPAQTEGRETVRGRFVIVRGDPPPDSGQPARVSYILTDKQERRWTLVFDESVYSPPGGIQAFNGKDVEVEGKRIGENRLLVASIRAL